MAPCHHLMAYCIMSHGRPPFFFGNRHLVISELVLLHPDDGSVESWTEGSGDKMLAGFADFEPRFVTSPFGPLMTSPASVLYHDGNRLNSSAIATVSRNSLSFVESMLKWRLMDRKPLLTWVRPKGCLVLLGDACHPMLVCMLPCGPGGMC